MATLVKAITHVGGTIIYASSVGRNEDDVVSTINNLNSLNLVASAVGTTQLENLSVDVGKIADSAVVFRHYGDASLPARAVDHEVVLYLEVFS